VVNAREGSDVLLVEQNLSLHLKVKSEIRYVEIKCQLDATDVFIADPIFAQHVSDTTMTTIRSSRVL